MFSWLNSAEAVSASILNVSSLRRLPAIASESSILLVVVDYEESTKKSFAKVLRKSETSNLTEETTFYVIRSDLFQGNSVVGERVLTNISLRTTSSSPLINEGDVIEFIGDT